MTDPGSAAPNYLDMPAVLREYASKLAARDIGFEDNDLSMLLPHVADDLEAKDAEIAALRTDLNSSLRAEIKLADEITRLKATIRQALGLYNSYQSSTIDEFILEQARVLRAALEAQRDEEA